jgi:hypothetical protein
MGLAVGLAGRKQWRAGAFASADARVSPSGVDWVLPMRFNSAIVADSSAIKLIGVAVVGLDIFRER